MSGTGWGTGVRVRRFGARGWWRLLLVMVAAAGALVRPDPVRAIEEAQAAQGPPLNIALFVSSRGDLCHDTGEVAAATRLATQEQARINRRGGVAGRPINVRIFDDERNEAKLIANMRAALADRNLLGMVGLSNSARAKALFGALGNEIRVSGAPFLSAISVSSLFADYPNVFTSQASQDEERVPVMAAFTRALGFAKPAFVGSADSVMSDAMRDSLLNLLGDKALVADRRIRVTDGKADAADIAAAVSDLEKQAPDLIYLSVGSRAAPDVIAALKSARVTPALFISGRIDALPPDMVKAYPGPLYQLAWEDLPEVFNNKVRALVERNAANTWVFEGVKVAQAPGWKKGECKERSEATIRDPFESANMRAINAGARYADMVSLIARTVRRMPPDSSIGALRSRVVSSLTSDYAVGRGAFKGSFENWSFDPATRTAARTPFVVMHPQGLERLQLAPVQFRRARDGQLRQISTLYADIDLIKAHRVDDSTKTFMAEFYLALRDAPGIGIDRLDFANAVLDPSTQGRGRQISIETIHDGGSNGMFPPTMKIYKIAGRFLFEPRLSKYPFDTQSFSIDLQPKTGNAAFMIQPPPTELRDPRVATDGWEPIEQYVGYQEEFVPVVDSFTHQAGIAPFYSSSFVWQMRRETTDYFLRVVVPLAFILAVAYLAIFIPMSRFDSIVAIQVTALLSAVALYISLPKIDSDDATLSDRIFLFDYLMVSVMIAITILRINPLIEGRPWVRKTLEAVHVVAIPAIVVVGAFYVYGLSVAGR